MLFISHGDRLINMQYVKQMAIEHMSQWYLCLELDGTASVTPAGQIEHWYRIPCGGYAEAELMKRTIVEVLADHRTDVIIV